MRLNLFCSYKYHNHQQEGYKASLKLVVLWVDLSLKELKWNQVALRSSIFSLYFLLLTHISMIDLCWMHIFQAQICTCTLMLDYQYFLSRFSHYIQSEEYFMPAPLIKHLALNYLLKEAFIWDCFQPYLLL